MAETVKIVGYFRISGRLQGLLRAELEEQRAALQAFAVSSGATVIEQCVDYENGSRSPLVQLDKALGLCRFRGAMLVMPKMGPLAKDWNVLVKLYMAEVHVVALDMPTLSREKLKELAVHARRNDKRLPPELRTAGAASTPAQRNPAAKG
ncbi:hypothetical protein [uncultured Alsobacter sp.]|uniref:hypothetical protein n=1 Tax=uncultured Alsobacter sp. TaxID=1748258 RepID=UPI0025D566D0|nr:hypothetical protein [uncultured Alsobacter sp.]